MVLTPSTMLPLGTALPAFELVDTRNGQLIKSADLKAQITLVGFICNHCPYVVHIQKQLAEFCNELHHKGLQVILISANDPINYPQDAPEKMTQFAASHDFQFPYCFDESQGVAKAFAAACTPEFYLFNEKHKLVYRGQFDGSRPGNKEPVTGQDLREAVELAQKGLQRQLQIPSVGCNIKWRE